MWYQELCETAIIYRSISALAAAANNMTPEAIKRSGIWSRYFWHKELSSSFHIPGFNVHKVPCFVVQIIVFCWCWLSGWYGNTCTFFFFLVLLLCRICSRTKSCFCCLASFVEFVKGDQVWALNSSPSLTDWVTKFMGLQPTPFNVVISERMYLKNKI